MFLRTNLTTDKRQLSNSHSISRKITAEKPESRSRSRSNSFNKSNRGPIYQNREREYSDRYDDRHRPRRDYTKNTEENDPSVKNPGTCVYVQNLPLSMTELEFKEIFEGFGEIESSNIVRNHITKESRGFGFINFVSSQSANDSIVKMNEKSIDGKNLIVQISRRRIPREHTPGQYLGNNRYNRSPRDYR